MWGAVIGDLAGSRYEYKQYENTCLIDVETLVDDTCFYSDDTILTIAVYEGIFHNGKYEEYLRMYGKRFRDYRPTTSLQEHFGTTFGGGFAKWVDGKGPGKSIGNGAMMRISGVGKMFDTEEDVVKNAMLATIPSHNTEEAIDCARKVALIIYYARIGKSKKEIIELLNLTHMSYEPFTTFNKTCYETLGNCLYALFTSNSFEEAVKKVISYGGDTDTNGAIVGAMAEAMFGVPDYLVTFARRKIPSDFVEVLDRAYQTKMA